MHTVAERRPRGFTWFHSPSQERVACMHVAVAAGYERIDRTDKDVLPGSGLTFTATRQAN